MKNRLFLIVLASFVSLFSYAQKINLSSWEQYEIRTVQVGSDGTKFVKVWGTGGNIDKAMRQAAKNAVHACIFKGLPASANANATPALFREGNLNPEQKKYFESFFKNKGDYLQFINITTDKVPSGKDAIKVRWGYEVAVYVQVLFDNLRNKLEEDGMIKKLNEGF